MSRSGPYADSGNLPGYYGILNAQREFWTHTVHGSRKDAENHIRTFWGQQTDMVESCLRDFQIIEVRVRLEPRAASVDTRRMVETENTGSMRSTGSAVPNGETPDV